MNLLVNFPKISMLYAGILGLMYMALSVEVIRHRWKERKGLGHDPDPHSGLFKAIRIHGNFQEYVPLLLLMMLMDEMSGRDTWILHFVGASTITARTLHFIGIKKSHLTSAQRSLGVLMTLISLLVMSVLLIAKGLA
jgi:uncharacterized protein